MLTFTYSDSLSMSHWNLQFRLWHLIFSDAFTTCDRIENSINRWRFCFCLSSLFSPYSIGIIYENIFQITTVFSCLFVCLFKTFERFEWVANLTSVHWSSFGCVCFLDQSQNRTVFHLHFATRQWSRKEATKWVEFQWI